MTYAMTLDNSWEIMNDEEMYDVNGGGSIPWWAKTLVAVGIAAFVAAVVFTAGAILVAGWSAVMAIGPVSALIGVVGAKVAISLFIAAVGAGTTFGALIANWL